MALPHMASSNQQQFKIGYIPWWSFPKNELRVHSNNNTWWILLKMWDRMTTLRCFPGSLSLTDKQSPINDWRYQRRREHTTIKAQESQRAQSQGKSTCTQRLEQSSSNTTQKKRSRDGSPQNTHVHFQSQRSKPIQYHSSHLSPICLLPMRKKCCWEWEKNLWTREVGNLINQVLASLEWWSAAANCTYWSIFYNHTECFGCCKHKTNEELICSELLLSAKSTLTNHVLNYLTREFL